MQAPGRMPCPAVAIQGAADLLRPWVHSSLAHVAQSPQNGPEEPGGALVGREAAKFHLTGPALIAASAAE
jgi:hypothetical protein